MIDWTSTAPTEPGVYLWRRIGDDPWDVWVLRLAPDRHGDMRVLECRELAGSYLEGKTARSLRGQWIGPLAP